MWPVAGVNVGRVDAVESSFVRDVTADSCDRELARPSHLGFNQRTILLPIILPTEGAIYTFSLTT